jgi:hypothetical protein
MVTVTGDCPRTSAASNAPTNARTNTGFIGFIILARYLRIVRTLAGHSAKGLA